MRESAAFLEKLTLKEESLTTNMKQTNDEPSLHLLYETCRENGGSQTN